MFLLPGGATVKAVDLSFYGDIVRAGLTANLKVCLDAGSADSYSGSGQVWLDLSGNGYDFNRVADSGIATDDPTFNGSAGGLSSSDYWSVDGGDFFSYDTTVEGWMSNLHHDSALFTIAFWLYSVGSGGDDDYITTFSGTGRGGITIMNPGATNPYFSAQAAGTGIKNISSDTAMNNDAWNFVAISYDEAAGSGGAFHYLNGAYNQHSGSDTFDAAYSGSVDTSAATPMGILARSGGTHIIDSGNLIAGLMVWEGVALTKANLDTLWAAQKGRFGL